MDPALGTEAMCPCLISLCITGLIKAPIRWWCRSLVEHFYEGMALVTSNSSHREGGQNGKLNMFRWPDLLVRMRGPEREGVSAPIAAIRCGMNQGLLRGHNRLPQR